MMTTENNTQSDRQGFKTLTDLIARLFIEVDVNQPEGQQSISDYQLKCMNCFMFFAQKIGWIQRIHPSYAEDRDACDAYLSKKFHFDQVIDRDKNEQINFYLDRYGRDRLMINPAFQELFKMEELTVREGNESGSTYYQDIFFDEEGFYDHREVWYDSRWSGGSSHQGSSVPQCGLSKEITINSQSRLRLNSSFNFKNDPDLWYKLSMDCEPQCSSIIREVDETHDYIELMVKIYIAVSVGCCDHSYFIPGHMITDLIEEYPLSTWVYGLFDGGQEKFYDRVVFLQHYLRSKMPLAQTYVDKFMIHVFELLDGFDETFSERYNSVLDMENLIYKIAHFYSYPVTGSLFPMTREQLMRLGYIHYNNVTEPQSGKGKEGLFEKFDKFLNKQEIEREDEPEISSFQFAKSLFQEYKKGNISRDISSMETMIEDIKKIASDLPLDKANLLMDKITNLVEKFDTKDDKDPRQNNRNILIGYILLTCCVLLYFKYGDQVYLLLSSAIAGYLVFATDFKAIFSRILKGTGLWNSLYQFISDYFLTETAPQMELGLYQRVCQLFGSVFTVFLISGTPAEKRYEEIYRKISGWDKFTNNLSSIFKVVIDSAAEILDCTLGMFSDKYPSAKYSRWLSTNNVEIDEFIAEVDVLCAEFYSLKLKSSQSNLLRTEKLRMKGRKLISQLGRTSVPVPMQQVMRELETILKKLHSSDSAALGNRVEPLFLLFIGPPGIGKSKVSRSIAHYLVAKSLDTEEEKIEFVEDCNYYMYYRKSGEPYWEGYDPTMKAVIYDDINQYVDVEGGPYSELLELIYLINSEPYPLNMAFDFKGKMFAVPDLVFASTNSPTPQIKSINHQDAYYRRCKHSFYAVPKTEYTLEETINLGLENRKLDFNKVPKDENGISIIGKDVLDFYPVRYPSTGNYEIYDKPKSYDEICEYALKELEFNRAVHKQECEMLRKERLRALKEDFPETKPESYMAFNADDSIMQAMAEETYASFDEDEFDEYLPDKWTEEGHRILIDFLNSVTKNKTSAIKMMFVLTKFYISHNESHFQDVPTIEEVLSSYAVRFGSKFVDLLITDSYEDVKEFCFHVLCKTPRFTRRFKSVVFPFKTYSFWTRIKSKIGSIKESIFVKYIKGTWIEYLYKSVKFYIDQNPILISMMTGAFVFQYALSWIIKRFVTPVYQELNDISKDIELSATTIHEIHKREPQEIELIYNMMETDKNFLSIMSNDELDIEQKKVYLFQVMQCKELERKLNPAKDERTLESHISELTSIEENPEYGKQIKQKSKIRSRIKQSQTKPQMGLGLDNNGDNIMMKVMNCNSYELYIQEDHLSSELTKLGSILFVRGYVALHPKHYLVRILKIWSGCQEIGYDYGNTWIVLKQSNERYVREYKAKMKDVFTLDVETKEVIADYLPIPGCSDSVLSKIRFPNMGSSCDITKYFCTVSEFKNCSLESQGVVLCPSQGVLKIVPVIAKKQSHIVQYTFNDEFFDCKNTFSYMAPTKNGDCGSVLALNKPKLSTSRIFGMHVAGGTTANIGHAETCCREPLLLLLKEFDKNDVVIHEFDDNVVYTEAQCAIGQFQVLGKISPKQPLSFNSALTKSPLFEKLEVECKEIPAILGKVNFKGELTDPWDHNLKKYCKNSSIYIDPEHLKVVCAQILIDLQNESSIDGDKDVLTLEEAVLGEEKFDLGSCPRDTSPGYPHICNNVPGFPKRTRFFGKDPEFYDLDNDYYRDLKKSVDNIVDSAKNNIRLNHYCCDSLKDETVNIDKVKENLKTRIFNNLPLEKFLVDKMYFGAFASWITKNKISNSFAIGVNPYSTDWDVIARLLLRFGHANLQNVGAGDHKCFDGNEILQILQAILDEIINPWYNDEEGNEIRRILFMECLNSQHIRGEFVYKWEGGNISGWFMTTLINCLYHRVVFYLSWLKMHHFDYLSLQVIKDHLIFFFMGDDNIFSVSALYQMKFTEFYLSETMKDYGLIYTSELKDTVNIALRTIQEVEFLKRKFKFDPSLGRWMGALRLDSSIQGLYWTKSDPEKYWSVIKDKVDTVLCELSIHGKEEFLKEASIINRATRRFMNYTSNFSVYELAYAAVLKREYVF